MQTFVSIAEEGSLTRAANTLGKALPTVVRSLALLEEHLGVRLAIRTTRRWSLTEEGQLYLERCKQVLADVDEVEQALSLRQASPQGLLRITAPVLFGQLKVAPLVTQFLKSHPKLRVELVLLDRVVHLVDEGFDIGIRIAALEDSSLIASKVGEVRRVVVGSPALIRRVGLPRHPADLASKPTVTRTSPADPNLWTFSENGKLLTAPVLGALCTNHGSAAVEACVAGLGFGQFLSYQVEVPITERRLRRILVRFEPAPIPVHILFAHARLLSSRTRVLVDWLKKHLPTSTSGSLAS